MGQPRPKAFRVDGDPHKLLSELVEVVGAGRVDFTEAVKALYAAPPKEENGLGNDEELCGLIEEMAVTDQANTGDLKAYKENLSRKLVSKLQRQRAWERKQAAAEKRATAARKAAAAAKPRKRRGAALLRAMRRRRAAEGVEEPHAAAPAIDDHAVAAVAPEPAELPVAPIAVGDPPPLRVAPPVAVGDWRVVAAPGGWLRYNPTLCRLDAHCACHAACKMDRALRKGPVGLLCARLAAGFELPDRAAHNDLKRVLSHGDAFARRVEAREELRRLRVTHGGIYSEILEQEHGQRGEGGEPAALACH